MSPRIRLTTALGILGVFAWALVPRTVVTATVAGPSPEVLLAESRAAYDAGNWKAALGPTEALTKRFPNQHLFAQRLAYVYQGLGRHADEATMWERVFELAPTAEGVCPAIGEAYEKASNQDAAIDAYGRCREREPKNGDFIYFHARAYRRAGQVEAAERTYREALAADPAHVDTAVALASLRLQNNNPGEALQLTEPLLKAYPTNTDVLLVAGMSYHRLDRREEARSAIGRGLELNDTYPDLHIAMGIIDFTDGRARDAHAHFARVVELAPSRRAEVQVWLDRTKDAA